VVLTEKQDSRVGRREDRAQMVVALLGHWKNWERERQPKTVTQPLGSVTKKQEGQSRSKKGLQVLCKQGTSSEEKEDRNLNHKGKRGGKDLNEQGLWRNDLPDY